MKYEYDDYGRLEKMHTFRGGSGWNEGTWPATTGDPDTTEWVYDNITGLLTAKTYADGKQTKYDYTADGKLKTRTWARSSNDTALTTTYEYKDKTGELKKIDYSDDTQDIDFAYDLLGRQTYVKDAAGERTFEYDPNTLAFTGERIDGAS